MYTTALKINQCGGLLFSGVFVARIYKKRYSRSSQKSKWLPIGAMLLLALILSQQAANIPSVLALLLASVFELVGRPEPSRALPELLWFFLASAVTTIFKIIINKTLLDYLSLGFYIILLLHESYMAPRVPNGYDEATIFSKISGSYLNKMLDIGIKRPLRREDFAKAPRALNSLHAFVRFQMALDKCKQSDYRVIIALLMSLSKKLMGLISLYTFTNAVGYLRPLVLAYFLRSLLAFREGTASVESSIYLSILLAGVHLLSIGLNCLYSILNDMAYASSRCSMMGSIYRKSLKLSPKARERYDSAKIMNLLNVDAASVQVAYDRFPTLLSAPLGILICTWQLYHFLGLSSVAALPVYLFFIPYSSWYTRKMFRRFPEMMTAKDARTQATCSVLQNIKSLKLYAWEDPYYDNVAKTRATEVSIRAKYLRLASVMNTVSSMLTNIVAAVIFIAFLYLSESPLTPDVVFPTISLLGFLSDPFFAFPRAVSGLGRAFTSQQRINAYLSEEELGSSNYLRSESPDATAVSLENVTLHWTSDESQESLALENLTLDISKAHIVCLVGKVGKGKTSFLKALCGQMYVSHGSINVNGTIAYCSQEPWLRYLSIRKNILFGLTFDEEYYAQVIKACDLQQDLDALPNGDETDIGEKGIRLSGGQKARIALARAIYSRADIYLLDDVLAAVDEHVATRLISGLFAPTGLLAGSTVIVATNSKRLIPYASRVIALDTKTIVFDGTPAELAQHNTHYHDIELDLNLQRVDPKPRHFQPVYDPKATVFEVAGVQLRDESSVDPTSFFKVFERYLHSASIYLAGAGIGLMVAYIIFNNGITIWLTYLSDQNLTGIAAAKIYILVYLLLSLLSAFFYYSAYYTFKGVIGNLASVKLHNQMLAKVIRTPMRFFETTSLGAIMNRFTGDIATVDSTLPSILYSFSRSVLDTIVNFTIMILGAPFVIIVVIPLGFLLNSYRQRYIPASKQLKRINSASKGPILSHIEESIKGSTTIAAFDVTSQFIEYYESSSDYWVESYFLRSSLGRWLNYRISVMTAFTTLASALSMVILVYYTSISVSIAGIVLYNTQRGGRMVSSIIKSLANLEVSAVAAERVFEYIDLEPESGDETSAQDPPPEWPTHGKVDVCNLSVRYGANNPFIFQDFSLSIKPNEKIGIVGRTGSGKSTLMLSLFRIIEPQEGHIAIDDINTSDIRLHTLRSRLSIIPQDAHIFRGSVRSNLDPLCENDDARLWQILDLCHLKQHFSQLGTGLDTVLFAGGENLSRGQAQLICLGRALVRKTSVLVLDEATASVDTETDRVIQDTIRALFRDRTILTVAHRLNTVLDSDRIAVLSQGRLVEFDTPQRLLDSKGALYELLNSNEGLD